MLTRAWDRRKWINENRKQEYRELLTTLTSACTALIDNAQALVQSSAEQISARDAYFKSLQVLQDRIFIANEIGKMNLFDRWGVAMKDLQETTTRTGKKNGLTTWEHCCRLPEGTVMSRLLTKSLPFTVVIALSIGLVIFRGAQAPQEPLPTAEMPMTDNEKAESTLYPQYGNLTKLSGLNPGEDVSVMVATAMHFFTKTPEERVRNVVCGADAIIRGEVQEALSHPTSEGTFLFTTYDVVVRDVIKGNPADSLRPGDEIMLSRPGGRLLLSGRSVIAVDENYLRLNVGNSYILYLKRIPQTGDFGPLAPDRSFGAQDTETLRLAREALNRCDAGGAPNAN